VPGARRALPPPLHARLPAEPDSVTEARHLAGDYAASLGAERGSVEGFVSEATSNVVKHAYRDMQPGFMTLDAQVTFQGQLLVSVEDQGGGMRPFAERAGLGLGLALMARLASSLSLERRRDGGTRVVAHFDLR
jgi:anti-sigma regulatory factor (Ser/Thr protein kinase)